MDNYSLKLRGEFHSYFKKIRSTDKVILVESNQIPSNQLALLIALPIMAKHFQANPVAFRVGAINTLQKLKQALRHKSSILWVAGARKFLCIKKKPISRRINVSKEFNIVGPDDLENFSYKGVYIGDIIYDEYLSSTQSSTINFEDKRFLDIFSDALNYVDTWENIFKKSDVSAICIWHDVYFYALPARVALKFKVEVFSVTTRGIYRLTSSWPHVGLDPNSPVLQNNLLSTETKALNHIRRGNETLGPGVIKNSKQDSFPRGQQSDVNRKTRVLIANHIFFDAPHCYGKMFYSDFEIWLKSLAEIARVTSYKWYLKPHPHAPFWKANDLIENFSKNNPEFEILPLDISQDELKKLKIDFVLTVHGTTALHYAAEGFKVINASKNNPYNKFSFSYTPDSREKYEADLRNLDNFDFEFKFEEVLMYVESLSSLEIENWLFKNHSTYFEYFATANDAMSTQVYAYFMQCNNSRKLPAIEKAILSFLKSGDMNLNRRHFSN